MRLLLSNLRLGPALSGVALVLPMLTACAKSERAADGRIPVAVHGVNHTPQEFTFVLADPLDKENLAGGETINAYGAGGTMCCFSLPKQWRPGLKVELKATKWLPRTAENVSSSIEQISVFDIPAYEQGKAAELWILRTADDEYSLVASNFQPDHPGWPGKTKGWPVPSVEYLRLIHSKFLKLAQEDVALYESLLAGLKNQPVEHGEESWEFRMVSDSDGLKAYKGPTDPAFLAMLRVDYLTGLTGAREKLTRLNAEQP